MKNILSYETARALKEAGFPQPETVELFQTWNNGRAIFFVDQTCRTGIAPEKFFESYPVYSPTADDILPLLPPGTTLEMLNGQPACIITSGGKSQWYLGSNLAEAAAAAWLDLTNPADMDEF
jgi:hypothetical protein